MRKLPWLLLHPAAALLVVCGGGGSASTPTGTVLGGSPAGIWRGTDSMTGLAVVALIDEVGEAEFIRADGALFSGELSTAADNTISAAGQAYAINDFPDGSTSGSWTMQGTLKERQTLSVIINLATAAGTSTTGTIELTFDSLYDQPSSLAELGGTFAPGNAFPYLVGSDGRISLSELICEGNGQFAMIDPAHDLYRVQITTKCDNREAFTWSGLATLDTLLSPQQLLVGWSGSGSGDGEDWIRQD